ncbi:small ribosomal subunit protein uS10c [Magnolia sinica]|uniref:small ribosomal subunit protein uS10c n=1 Tax=Magnolia sinica TaxID=86752 RepID=UPI00265A86E1|nr:small ribosomal subunit protein uS10c [Magnolia sinica]
MSKEGAEYHINFLPVDRTLLTGLSLFHSKRALMAISSISATFPILPLCNSNIYPKPKPSLLSFPSKLQVLKPSISSTSSNSSHFRVFSAPELLESEETVEPVPESFEGPDSVVFEVGGSEIPGTSRIPIGADVDAMAPKQKIRIKLKSYFVPFIEDSCKQIMDVARSTNAKTMGPVPLPTKKRIYCVLKSPHVHKDARFHFEIRTHQRLIDIFYPTAQTIDSLMQLDLPAAVDVQVKL